MLFLFPAFYAFSAAPHRSATYAVQRTEKCQDLIPWACLRNLIFQGGGEALPMGVREQGRICRTGCTLLCSALPFSLLAP